MCRTFGEQIVWKNLIGNWLKSYVKNCVEKLCGTIGWKKLVGNLGGQIGWKAMLKNGVEN